MKIKINSAVIRLLFCVCLFSTATAFASTFTWTGATDKYLQNSNNWSPVTVARPAGGNFDVLFFNGTQAGDLTLTNSVGPGPGPAGNFNAAPGFFLRLDAAQTGSLTILPTNGSASAIRLCATNPITVASGAGALTFGNGTAVSPNAFQIVLADGNIPAGGVRTHPMTNNSVNPVTFASDTCFVMGGGNNHFMWTAGTGNWVFNSKLQAQNTGGSVLSLVVLGPGTNILVGNTAPTTYSGGYGNLTVSNGTLQLSLTDVNAIGTGNQLIMAGGNLDNTVIGQTLANNNNQQWNGNWTYLGSQSLDLGFGTVTMNGSRVVTVNANTLTVGGVISGAGFSLTKAGAGTLALNGVNTYSGGTTISNGVLQLGNASAIPSSSAAAATVNVFGKLDLNGISPSISSLTGTGVVDTVSGGSITLTVGANNASSTFNGSIINSSGSVALSKTGGGVLTLGGASTYSGGTTVSAGTLLVTNVTGSGTGSGAVTVSSGATLGGSGIIGGSVDWQAGSFATFSQGSPLTVSSSVTLNNNSVTIDIPGATPLGATNSVLMTYNNSGSSGSFSSAGVAFTGAGLEAGKKIQITNGNGEVHLVVTASPNLSGTWTNISSGNWSAAVNWDSNPLIPQKAAESAVLGKDNRSAFTTVTLDIAVTNGFITFNNTNSFTIVGANTLTLDNTNDGAAIIVTKGTSNSIAVPLSLNDNLAISVFSGASLAISNVISGTSPSFGLTMGSGAGTLALVGNNTYGPSAGSIGTAQTGSGTLQLGHNNALGAGDLEIFSSSTIRAGTALTTPNNIIISNAATATFDNNGNNVTLSGVISGGGSLTKNGTGTLTLGSANSYSANTTVSAGTLQMGAVGSISTTSDVLVNTNAVLDLNGLSQDFDGLRGGGTVDTLSGGSPTLTVGENNEGTATFTGFIKNTAGSIALVKNGTGTEVLAGTNNTYSGGTTISAGTLQVGNGNTNSSGLGIVVGLGTGPVVDNGTLTFNLVGTNTFTNAISGAGALNLQNAGMRLNLDGNNSAYTGDINVNVGSLWITNSRALGIGPKTIAVVGGGNSLFTQLHLDGSRSNITLDSAITLRLSQSIGVLINEAGTNTVPGPILMPNGGGNPYIVVNSGFLTLAGPLATVAANNPRTLTLGGAGNGLVSGEISESGGLPQASLQKQDAGTWTITSTNTVTGTATIGIATANSGKLILNGQWAGGPVVVATNGTLAGTGLASNLTVSAGGKFVPGDYGSVGTFTVSNFLTMSGAVYASLNKSLAQSNTIVNIMVSGTTNVTATTGSSLVVSNLGPALVAGDTFKLFSQGVTNGNLMTLTLPTLSGSLFWTNTLAVDGSIAVVSPVSTFPPKLTNSLSGGVFTLSWPTDHLGWRLQVQTNSLNVGITTNWVDVPGSGSVTTTNYTVNPANGDVLFRLIYP